MHVEVRVDPSGDSARDSGHCHLFLSLGVGDTAPARRWTGQRWACAAGSYEVTPSDRLVSGECPSQADESTSGQSERTSAGIDGVRPGSGIHPHADQFSGTLSLIEQGREGHEPKRIRRDTTFRSG